MCRFLPLFPLLAVQVVAALSAPGAAQRIWFVDQRGRAGAQFTELQPAVDVAQPGDLIVASGVFASTVISKGLTVVSIPNEGAVMPVLTIRDLPVGQIVSLSSTTGTDQMLLTNNSGRVISDAGFPTTLLDIRDSSDVHIHQDSFPEVRIERSSVFFSSVSIACHALLCGRTHIPARVVDSTVTLSYSGVSGVGGVGDPRTCRVLQPPQPAVIAHNSTFILSAESRMFGGSVTYCSQVDRAPIFHPTSRNVTLIADPRASLGVVTPNNVQLTQRPMAGLAANSGGNWSILCTDVYGPPGGTSFTFASLPTDRPSSTPFGDLWLDPATLLLLDVGPLDSTGYRRHQLQWDPTLFPLTITLQAFLSGSAAPHLSAPCHVVLNIKSFRRS